MFRYMHLKPYLLVSEYFVTYFAIENIQNLCRDDVEIFFILIMSARNIINNQNKIII